MMTKKEKKSTCRIKQSSLLTEDEFFVAQILLDLPTVIRTRKSALSLIWGTKKRRSDGFNADVAQPQPKAAAAEEASTTATVSPVTPLAFLSSESDGKSRHAVRTSSRKRSRDKYITMIEELTQRRDLLRQEIGNVTKYYNKLTAHNSELKALRQDVLELELTQHHDISVEKSQPLIADHIADELQLSLGPIAAQAHSSYNGPGLARNVVPDLNVPAEEMDLPQPLDMRRDHTDKRAGFAEARRRRMDLIKIKSIRKGGVKLVRSR